MKLAVISECEKYRYTLRRTIPSCLHWVKPCLFIMLNPSIADDTIDDPTIRRCIGFARREGCTQLTVVNLFALRATDPKELARSPDPFGPENAEYIAKEIKEHSSIGIIIAAWGAHPMASKYAFNEDLQMALINSGAACLGMTSKGYPRHPLYVKSDQPLIPWLPAPVRPNAKNNQEAKEIPGGAA